MAGQSPSINFTADRINKLEPPEGKKQSFAWDSSVKGLGIRITQSSKVYVFQARIPNEFGKLMSFRMKIGDCRSITLEDARKKAKAYAAQVADGIDPRLEKVRTAEKEAAERKERNRQDITLGEAWSIYIKERKTSWSDSYYNLHIRLIHAGGEQRKRFKGKTVPGPLAPLAKLPISAICPSTVKNWLNKEKTSRPTQTRIAFEALRTFLNWCQDDERYIGLASPDACSAKIKRENLGRKNARNDCLEKSQLAAWFKAVKSYEHKGLVMATYVQSLLLTGARREELLTLKWSDLDFHWGKMKITGKGNIERIIPMPPYLAHILNTLPRKNEWVFSSRTGKLKRLQSPTKAHQIMCIEAGLEGLSLHGLRRSFSTLAEWTECSAGIIAQIQGHRPSAIAEKHYKKRPLDLLRMWHKKIEEFILCEAGIEQPQTASLKPLSLVEVKYEKRNPT